MCLCALKYHFISFLPSHIGCSNRCWNFFRTQVARRLLLMINVLLSYFCFRSLALSHSHLFYLIRMISLAFSHLSFHSFGLVWSFLCLAREQLNHFDFCACFPLNLFSTSSNKWTLHFFSHFFSLSLSTFVNCTFPSQSNDIRTHLTSFAISLP